jgi:hypothetical protein
MLLEEKLILFRNELKNKTIYNYKLSGIVLELLFSKKIFIKNIEIKKFIKEVFGLELKDYIFKSRSSIGIKISKLIIENDEKENCSYKKNLSIFINEKIESLKKSGKIKEEKNNFDGWIK